MILMIVLLSSMHDGFGQMVLTSWGKLQLQDFLGQTMAIRKRTWKNSVLNELSFCHLQFFGILGGIDTSRMPI